MKIFSRPFLEDPKYGLAKKYLEIVISESEDNRAYEIFWTLGFTLTIKLTKKFTSENAREYFDSLANKIENEDLTQIIFKLKNDFFVTDD